MEIDFDKEIDALVRQTVRGETALVVENPKSPHLDADEIAAFAENALPEKAKLLYTAHLADCGRCRTILSNVISLNSETPIQNAPAEQIRRAAPVVIPWYRRLFAVPNLAYAMGALLLVFVGLIAFTFVKNSTETDEISRTREVPINMGGASSDGETREIQSGASSNSMMSNSAVSVQSNAAMVNSSAATSETRGSSSSNTPAMSNGAVTNESIKSETEAAKNKTQPNTTAAAPALPPPDENQARGSSFAEPKRDKSDDEKTLAEEDKSDLSVKSRAATTAKPPAPKPDSPSARSADSSALSSVASAPQAKKSARVKESEEVENKSVGGKNFRRSGSVWYDAAYNGQSTTNVARGSSEFKKLDANLRSIAGALSGTIVVVFGGKAYRIQ